MWQALVQEADLLPPAIRSTITPGKAEELMDPTTTLSAEKKKGLLDKKGQVGGVRDGRKGGGSGSSSSSSSGGGGGRN